MIEDEFPGSAQPFVPEAPRQAAQETNSTFIPLAPESQPPKPNRSRAEVSNDSRFRMINPNAARTVVGEKIFHSLARKRLFENVEPVDLGYGGEHQRGIGWAQDRVGTTPSGTQVHVRRMEFTSYSVQREPSYHEDLAVHQTGIAITVEHGERGKDARSLHWFLPKKSYGQEGLSPDGGAKDTPEHIRILDATKAEPLVLTPWSVELGHPDARYDSAIQEIGTLLSEPITWQKSPQVEQAAA